jgi:hypothetical protein
MVSVKRRGHFVCVAVRPMGNRYKRLEIILEFVAWDTEGTHGFDPAF